MVAVGAVACAACCAPLILGAAGITIALSAVAWVAGGVLAAVAVGLVGALVIRRRRAAA